MSNDRRLIEDFLPIQAISAGASREKSVHKEHISTPHFWWLCKTEDVNLSDGAKVRIKVEGNSADGFDPLWLRNAVDEPLDEADIERMPEG